MARRFHVLAIAPELYDALAIVGTFPAPEEGVAYDQSLPITGGTGTYVLTTSSGVPTGLTLSISGTNLRLSGTPGPGTSSISWPSLSGTVDDFDPYVVGTTHTQAITVNDGYDSLVLDLLHLDGANGSLGPYTNLGNSGSTWSQQGGAGGGLITAASKFGTASYSTGDVGGLLAASSSPTRALGTQDFCIEFEIYPRANDAVYGRLMQMGGATPANGDLFLVKTNSAAVYQVFAQVYDSGAYHNVIDPATATNLTPSVWTHVAFTRQFTGGNYVYRLFFNGTQVATKTTSIGANITYTAGVFLGNSVFGMEYLRAYFDEVRITRGAARYTTNFTRPTMAHPTP
jgi:hypothetical protein